MTLRPTSAQTPRKRIVVLGAQGQLGSELCRQLGSEAVPVDRSRCDLTRRDDVLQMLDELAPGTVINTAAYNFVDRAEQEPEACQSVNGDAVRYIAEACRKLDCTLVQVSTAYVFEGQNQSTPYRERDPAQPLSEYGRTKLAGERFAAEHARHFIVRTGPMFGPRTPQAKMTNFVDLMLRLGQTQNVVRVVNDQRCSPSHAHDVARAILFLLAAETAGSAAYGIYHVAGNSIATWHELAAEVFRQACAVARHAPRSIHGRVRSAGPGQLYAVLDTSKYQTLGGPELRGWRQALTDYLRS